jgi:hypothetical protein
MPTPTRRPSRIVIFVLKNLSAKFDIFTGLATVESIGKQMKAMDPKTTSREAKISDYLEENKTLKADIRTLDKIIEDLRTSQCCGSGPIGTGSGSDL